jgi:hypothetical protein
MGDRLNIQVEERGDLMERPRKRWEGNIKMDLKEEDCEDRK